MDQEAATDARGGSVVGPKGAKPESVGSPEGGAAGVEAFLDTTQVLVGVATHALEQLGDEVSVSQFRLLLALSVKGPLPSARVAEQLGSVASSVTRLADHLEDAGHVLRRRERPNRSVVQLELTDSGRALVERVVQWRRAELGRILERLPLEDRMTIVPALRRFCEAAGDGYGVRLGPLPL